MDETCVVRGLLDALHCDGCSGVVWLFVSEACCLCDGCECCDDDGGEKMELGRRERGLI